MSTFKNHIYPTKFTQTLQQGEINVYLLKKYIDDVNLAIGLLEKGWKWVRQTLGRVELEWTQERLDQDVCEDQPEEERSVERIREMASQLVDSRVFTVDLPSRHSNKKVPMLDISVWLEEIEGRGPTIRHSYYEKETTSPLVFHGRGACSSRQKIVTLAE